MKIFLIYGEKDAGKSTACSKILKLLLALDAKVKFYDTFYWGDFKTLVTFENKLIGIYTPGDERAHLREAIAFSYDNGCDILVVPVRKGIAYNAPLEETSEKDEVEWVKISKGTDENEMDHLENDLAINILNKIYNT
ncbi:MAG: hypothetical protein NC212_01250 [Staphylococcus sp.]|nr:hypothetical protein [Staphylococcus sp.]